MTGPQTKQPPKVQKEEFRFLLLGKTGSGKSTTGNTILGEDVFDADVSFESVTSECSLKRSEKDGRLIEILDSPGLFDTTKPHEEVSSLLMQAIACMHPGPDAVFYVMKIGRYTDEEHAVYTRLKALLDNNVTKYLIVLLTHGDALRGKDVTQFLSTAPDTMKEVLKDCESRVVVMDNRNKPPQQLEELFTVVRKLRAKNGGKPYVCPKYADIGTKMEEEISRRMLEVEKKELENKKHVQELSSALEKSKQQAETEKANFEKKEKEREAAVAAQRAETESKMKALAEDLEKKNASQEQQRKEMEALKAQMQQREARQKAEMEKQRQQEMERIAQAQREQQRVLAELARKKEEEERQKKQAYEQQVQALKDQIARTRRRGRRKGCVVM